jgi:NAD(P)-dependent dehydrogenase (short-subunit alcohol dehydrogenase family)
MEIQSEMENKTEDRKKIVFISGAGGGLGRALVNEFAGMGFLVIASEINADKLTVFRNMQDVIPRVLDATDPAAVRAISDELGLSVSGIDVLVSQAGLYDTFPVTEADPLLFRRIMDVNLHGTATLIQGLLQPLIRNNGRVIVVSSESHKVQALFQPYMISKAALEAYCKTARQELALKGVKLTVIRPGAMQTPLLNWMKSTGNTEKYPVYKKEYILSHNQSVKMVGKVISPEKVARIISRAASISNPKRIYRINNSMMLNIVSLLPVALLDKIVLWTFKK